MIEKSEKTENQKVVSYKNGEVITKDIEVVTETPLSLFLGDQEIVTLLYNGQDPKELAVGFFYSDGILENKNQITELSFDGAQNTCTLRLDQAPEQVEQMSRKRIVTSGCGKGSIYYQVVDAIKEGRITIVSDLTVTPEKLVELATLVFRGSELYKRTHGVHSVALCDLNGVVIFRDDIGRHNAMDKIAGRCMLDRIDTSQLLLFTTGRLTSEMMIKAGRLGCPIVVSRSSATSLALDFADLIGMTVVTGARAGGFTLFRRPERIFPEGI